MCSILPHSLCGAFIFIQLFHTYISAICLFLFFFLFIYLFIIYILSMLHVLRSVRGVDAVAVLLALKIIPIPGVRSVRRTTAAIRQMERLLLMHTPTRSPTSPRLIYSPTLMLTRWKCPFSLSRGLRAAICYALYTWACESTTWCCSSTPELDSVSGSSSPYKVVKRCVLSLTHALQIYCVHFYG